MNERERRARRLLARLEKDGGGEDAEQAREDAQRLLLRRHLSRREREALSKPPLEPDPAP